MSQASEDLDPSSQDDVYKEDFGITSDPQTLRVHAEHVFKLTASSGGLKGIDCFNLGRLCTGTTANGAILSISTCDAPSQSLHSVMARVYGDGRVDSSFKRKLEDYLREYKGYSYDQIRAATVQVVVYDQEESAKVFPLPGLRDGAIIDGHLYVQLAGAEPYELIQPAQEGGREIKLIPFKPDVVRHCSWPELIEAGKGRCM